MLSFFFFKVRLSLNSQRVPPASVSCRVDVDYRHGLHLAEVMVVKKGKPLLKITLFLDCLILCLRLVLN